jgi:hypothetical protein
MQTSFASNQMVHSNHCTLKGENISYNLRMWRCVSNSTYSGQGPFAASCERGNKYPRSIKCKRLRDWVTTVVSRRTPVHGVDSQYSKITHYACQPRDVLLKQKYPLQVQRSRYVAIWQRRDINLVLFQDLYVNIHDNTVFPFFRRFSHYINAIKKTVISHEMRLLHVYEVQNSSYLRHVIFHFCF